MLAVTVLLGAPSALAHDYWLQPEPAVLDAPGSVDVHLHLGQELVSEEDKPHLAERTVSLVHLHGGSRTPLSPPDQALPALDDLALEQAGGHLIALERNAAWIELDPEAFHAYLEHEGLQDVARAREAAGEQDTPGRERYTRYLKAWIPVGTVQDDTHALVVGHALELRLLDRPVAGQDLTVEAHVDGAPLAEQPLTAFVRRADRADEVVSVQRTTDTQGRVTFPAAAAGDWLVRTVHMRRCQDCPKADWESLWAAYRFPVRPAADVEEEEAAVPVSEPEPATSSGWGCGCRSVGGAAGAWIWIVGLVVVGRRRAPRGTWSRPRR